MNNRKHWIAFTFAPSGLSNWIRAQSEGPGAFNGKVVLLASRHPATSAAKFQPVTPSPLYRSRRKGAPKAW